MSRSFLKWDSSCRACRRGLRSSRGGDRMRAFIRKIRRQTKQNLRQGKYEPIILSVGYTD